MAARERERKNRFPTIFWGVIMSKTGYIHIWQALPASFLLLLLIGCGTSTLKTAPTVPPPYLHYTPSHGFDIHIEFDYPSTWFFSEEKIQNTDYISIGLGDPRLLAVPTRTLTESHGTASDFGRVHILIEPIKPNLTLEKLVEPHKQGYKNASWITPLNEIKITTDGYDAVVFEYQVEPIYDNGYTSRMFERNTFFIIKDQLYQITFLIAEKDRGGEFEKGYEIFNNSLKIIR
jgi:hypothetical protein